MNIIEGNHFAGPPPIKGEDSNHSQRSSQCINSKTEFYEENAKISIMSKTYTTILVILY